MSNRTPQLNARVAREVIAGLMRSGVTRAVVSPGSRNTPILLALAESEIQAHVVLDERSAGFFALGLSRVLDEPVILSCTSGSAGANYLPAVVEAYHGRHPLVVITSDRPAELHGCGAPQTMRQHDLYGEFVEASAHLAAPSTDGDCEPVLGTASELGATAVHCRGPVHLNLAFREPLWSASTKAVAPLAVPTPDRAVMATTPGPVSDTTFPEAGIIICGPDTARTVEERAVILDCAERLRWPVLAEASSGVRFGRSHPNLVTTYDALMRSDVAKTLVPESVIRFGRTNTSRPLNEWLRDVGADRVIAVDPSPFPSDPDRIARRHLRLRAVDYCNALLQENVASDRTSEWLSKWQHVEDSLRTALARYADAHWWEGSIARTVLSLAPEGAVIHLANSMPIRDVDCFCPPGGRRLDVYSNRGVNGIDGTLATIAGEAFAQPGKPVIALVGDLAFLHDAGSLALLRNARATIIVVDNGGGGIFEYLPISKHPEHFEELFITPQQGDLESVATGYGARTRRVHDLAALRQALEADVEREGVGVIIATVSRQDNVARHHEWWSQASAIVEQVL